MYFGVSVFVDELARCGLWETESRNTFRVYRVGLCELEKAGSASQRKQTLSARLCEGSRSPIRGTWALDTAAVWGSTDWVRLHGWRPCGGLNPYDQMQQPWMMAVSGLCNWQIVCSVILKWGRLKEELRGGRGGARWWKSSAILGTSLRWLLNTLEAMPTTQMDLDFWSLGGESSGAAFAHFELEMTAGQASGAVGLRVRNKDLD